MIFYKRFNHGKLHFLNNMSFIKLKINKHTKIKPKVLLNWITNLIKKFKDNKKKEKQIENH